MSREKDSFKVHIPIVRDAKNAKFVKQERRASDADDTDGYD
jgi:hypothetical protein